MNKDLDDILSISALFDVRVETLAATFLKQADGALEDFGLEQVVVSPKGGARRRVGNDVERVRQRTYEEEHTVLMMEVNRKGLFDTLPSGLFLDLDQDFVDAKARTKSVERQIKEARKFFLPFELASYHPRIAAEQLEQKYTEQFPKFVHKLWGLDEFSDLLDDRQRFLLCYLIPEAQRIVGNLKFTQLIFEAVLKNQVQLNTIAPLEIEIPKNNTPDTEKMSLGADAIVGATFKDDILALEIRVANVRGNQIEQYLENGKKRQLLEQLLISYFVPLDVAVVIRVEVRAGDYTGVLNEAVLGYNLKLA